MTVKVMAQNMISALVYLFFDCLPEEVNVGNYIHPVVELGTVLRILSDSQSLTGNASGGKGWVRLAAKKLNPTSLLVRLLSNLNFES